VLEALFVRRRALVAAFALTVVVTLAVHPTWAQSIGADVWNMPTLRESVRNAEAEGERLDAEDAEVLSRIRMKESIVTDLVAGRITMAEATDQFTELCAPHPAQMEVIRDRFPGATDREKIAHNVIAFALQRVDPDQRDAIASRLENDLRQMLAAGASH
jgi:hypothetical protein